MNCADGIQAAVFPKPPIASGTVLADIWPLGTTRAAAVVGQVHGYGEQGADLAAHLRTALRAGTALCDDPGVVLTQINRALLQDLPTGAFAAVTLCVLDAADGRFLYSSAGSACPLLLGPDWKILDSTRAATFPLGLNDDPSLALELSVPPGGTILLRTVGVDRCKSPAGEKYIPGPLAAAISKVADRSAGPLAEAVVRAAGEHAGGTINPNDLAVLAILYRKDDSEE